MSAPRTLGILTIAAALVAGVSACGTNSIGGSAPDLGSDLAAAVAQVQAAGKPAYYLGSTVDDLPLTGLDLVEENAPAFQVEADYGHCESSGDGGCAAPVVVSTNDLVTDVRGLHCMRLEPHLGVPAGVVMGELTLVTGHLVVTVSDFRGRDGSDKDITHALRLLPHLQAVGAPKPVGTLPPPDAAGAAWVDELCGTTPGQEVSHDFDGEPTG